MSVLGRVVLDRATPACDISEVGMLSQTRKSYYSATRFRLHTCERWGCIFGCDCEDKLEHYLQCHVALSALAVALGQQMPILAPSLIDILPLSSPWTQKSFLKIFWLFSCYHTFLSKHSNTYERRTAACYPTVVKPMLASAHTAENIGLSL